MVRIHFPPALSPLRTSSSGGKRVERSAEPTGDDPDGEYLKRNRLTASGWVPGPSLEEYCGMYIVTMVFATLRPVGADLTVAAPPNSFARASTWSRYTSASRS